MPEQVAMVCKALAWETLYIFIQLISSRKGPTLELPLEQVQSAFDTNVFSVLRVNRAVFPHMAARKQGMFITIGSIVAEWYAHLYLSLFH